jgi:5-(aminomethyl)-3-furanmethanol phosphate kinase
LVKPLHVGKVGGSLFDFPGLAARLRTWIDAHADERVLLIPGGGPTADAIRTLQVVHELDDGKAHWLAIRAMAFNAHIFADLLNLPVVSDPAPTNAVLDVYPFLKADDRLEHSWSVTSDSIAARVAQVHGARLTLFKSVDLPEGMSWAQAAEAGFVDRAFPAIAEGLDVDWVNLRVK